nr:hypothetical protein [Bacteroidota bacterium]
MKYALRLIILLLILQSTKLSGQDTETVAFTASLMSVLSLNVTAGAVQTATFDTPAEYNFGIDAVGSTTVTMESTSNWDLKIRAANFINGGASIPINNLGVWCQATGAHTFGSEVTCSYTSLANAKGVTTIDQILINNGSGNRGNAADNTFNLNWTMGTMNGTMNGTSMFTQVANGTIGALGTFNTTVNLTLTAL